MNKRTHQETKTYNSVLIYEITFEIVLTFKCLERTMRRKYEVHGSLQERDNWMLKNCCHVTSFPKGWKHLNVGDIRTIQEVGSLVLVYYLWGGVLWFTQITSIVSVVEWMMLRWDGQVTRMGDKNTWKILVENSWKPITSMINKEKWQKYAVEYSGKLVVKCVM
jgi:hypothetical protein